MIEKLPAGVIPEYPLAQNKVEMVEAYMAQKATFQPATPRFAATVMLVRDSEFGVPASNTSALDVFMLKRAPKMAFVPGAAVFPGGRVDERDADASLPWIGPDPSEWARQMRCDEQTARCIVVAAVREVFEECGVLLAGLSESSVADPADDPLWDSERTLLENRQASFSEILIKHKLSLRSDLLCLKSRWMTPAFESRRYDTFFFAALLPSCQAPRDCNSEAETAGWKNPRRVLDQANEGTLLVLPPTAYNLSLIDEAATAAEFIADSRTVERIMLEPVHNQEGNVMLRCTRP